MEILPAFKLILERLRSPDDLYPDPSLDGKIDWLIAKLGERSKFGGEPDWIQDYEEMHCDSCKKDMVFVAQIDSIEQQSSSNPHSVNALSPDQKWMFGDVGMIYVFFCKECLTTKSTFQCG